MRFRDALKKVNFGTSAQRGGEGVLVKSLILINAQFGTLLDRRGVSKVHVPKCDLILVFIFEVLAPKTLNFTVFTDRTNYYRECSHKLHDKKMNIPSHLCFFEFIARNF